MNRETVSSPVKVIDFDRACLTWTMHDGSCGRWRVIASATRMTSAGADERFVLAPVVMAGDVYGKDRLPLFPPYSFQIIASTSRHVIWREYAGAPSKRDSAAPNSDVFSSIEIYIPPLDATHVDLGASTPAAVAPGWPLTARVETISRDGSTWLLEFPINHINNRDGENGTEFQAETGPILVPESIVDLPGISVCGGFALAYLFFNRLDRIDLALWGQLSEGAVGRAFGCFHRIVPTRINAYSRSA